MYGKGRAHCARPLPRVTCCGGNTCHVVLLPGRKRPLQRMAEKTGVLYPRSGKVSTVWKPFSPVAMISPPTNRSPQRNRLACTPSGKPG